MTIFSGLTCDTAIRYDAIRSECPSASPPGRNSRGCGRNLQQLEIFLDALQQFVDGCDRVSIRSLFPVTKLDAYTKRKRQVRLVLNLKQLRYGIGQVLNS